MGQRTVKRVPLDFDHPLKEVWPGYLCPQPRPCPNDVCDNGRTPARAWLDSWVHVLMVAGTNPDHPWVRAIPLIEREPDETMAELTEGLAGRTPSVFGHDAIDGWAAARKVIEAAGLDDGWGVCPTCGGLAYHPDDEGYDEEWEETDPPSGDGWQLWETTSEGSPVSPVFETPEGLASWCEVNATLVSPHGATYEQWLSMFVEGDVEVASTMVFRTSK